MPYILCYCSSTIFCFKRINWLLFYCYSAIGYLVAIWIHFNCAIMLFFLHYKTHICYVLILFDRVSNNKVMEVDELVDKIKVLNWYWSMNRLKIATCLFYEVLLHVCTTAQNCFSCQLQAKSWRQVRGGIQLRPHTNIRNVMCHKLQLKLIEGKMQTTRIIGVVRDCLQSSGYLLEQMQQAPQINEP